jgi:5-(carboxyamino)imidazole ribonucleotide mutase
MPGRCAAPPAPAITTLKPVGTLAIGRAGAVNAALLAAAVLALTDAGLAERLDAWRDRQTASVAERPDPSQA